MAVVVVTVPRTSRSRSRRAAADATSTSTSTSGTSTPRGRCASASAAHCGRWTRARVAASVELTVKLGPPGDDGIATADALHHQLGRCHPSNTRSAEANMRGRQRALIEIS